MDSGNPLSERDWWSDVQECGRQALAAGALHPLPADVRRVRDGDLDFIVRVLSGENPKPRPLAGDDAPDPFRPPYESVLHVGDVGPDHAVLLNKYNVLADHALVVTREWREQTEHPDRDDFAAWLTLLADGDALGFFNGGEEAGASQPHLHMQAVPLPLGEQHDPPFPWFEAFESALRSAEDGQVFRIPELPFAHAVIALPTDWREAQDFAADRVLARYASLWQALGFPAGGRHQPVPCNLLIARDWMWLVPRLRESHDGISVNALGFAGALLVGDEEAFNRLSSTGPLAVLEAVVRPPETGFNRRD